MVEWYRQLKGNEFEQTLGDSDREVCGVLQSEGSQRVRPNLVTEQQQS